MYHQKGVVKLSTFQTGASLLTNALKKTSMPGTLINYKEKKYRYVLVQKLLFSLAACQVPKIAIWRGAKDKFLFFCNEKILTFTRQTVALPQYLTQEMK